MTPNGPAPCRSRAGSEPIAPRRRRFIAVALGGIVAAITGILAVPLAGFFALPALGRAERRWLEVGPLPDFPEGQVPRAPAKPLTAQVWPYETPRVALFVLNRGAERSPSTTSAAPMWGAPFGGTSRPAGSSALATAASSTRKASWPGPPRPLDRYEFKIEKGVLYAGRVYMVNDKLEFTRWYA